MIEFLTSGGIRIDLAPNQEVSLSLENALFSNDHIPVAWTTDVELPISMTNSRLFGYPDAMLLAEQRQEINATMYINGIPVILGKLKLTGKSDSMLQASFIGVSVEDSLVGSLKDAPFNRWEFGSALLDQRPLFDEIMTGAANNSREDFALPLMVRESEKDTADNYVGNSEIGAIRYESFGLKYLNSPQCNYVVPVVKLKYILQTVFADCRIDEAYSDYFGKIGIVAPYRKNAAFTFEGGFNLPHNNSSTSINFILDLAEAMPDVSVADFVKNMLATFCATIFIFRGEKQMISNKAIIQATEFTDWSAKISDDIEQEFEPGQSYEYGFSGITDTDITETITDCTTIADCFNAAENTIVRCADTGDIYRRVQRPYIAGHGAQTYYNNGLELVRQEAMIPKETPDKSIETFSATTDWVPVKCIPYIFRYTYGSSMIYMHDGVMLPIIDMPTVGGARPTTIYFGLLETNTGGPYTPTAQLTSNGYIGGTILGSFTSSISSLNLMGTFGLYERYHKDFEAWLAKDKTTTKIAVNLSAADIADLRIWKKIMLYNRLFFIKALSITLNTSKDYIHTEAELVVA